MMEYPKKIYVKDYIDIYNHYKSIYDNAMVLIQVGGFYECYATDTDGPDIKKLAEELDYIVSKKDKKKELSKSNPYMLGFPLYKIDDLIEKIVANNYTVIRIDQVTEPPNPERKVVGIFSSSTCIISNNNDTKNLGCLYMDIITSNGKYILCFGMSSYDLSTGKGCVYETVSKNDDYIYCLDDTIRFFESYKPSEIIIDFSDNFTKYMETNKCINNMTFDDMILYMGLNTINRYKMTNKKMLIKAKFQQIFLDNIFGKYNDKNNIYNYSNAMISLVGLLDFAKSHQPLLINKITEPEWYSSNKYLFLGNKALEQLNVLEGDKSLFSIINKTKTSMGKRLLKDTITKPIFDIDELNNRYSMINKINKLGISNDISAKLNYIADISKLLRRMELNNIHPSEMYNFYISMKQVKEYISFIKEYDNIYKKLDYKYIDEIDTIITFIDDNFDIEYMSSINYSNYKEETHNYIKKNKDLDDIENDITIGNNFMDILMDKLMEYVKDDKKFISKNTNTIKLKYNDKQGYYFLMTKRRSKLLKKELEKVKDIKIGSKQIKIDDLIFTDLPAGNDTKIHCEQMRNISNDVIALKVNLANHCKNNFYEIINIIVNSYSIYIEYYINIISYIDFINSGAICAKTNGYCRPKINQIEKSYFNAKELRHPIVEYINTECKYTPHNINIGDDINGILLYGVNSSGKSTLMKSIGLNLILAQIGYYVAAKKYTYNPYKSLFTRIVGNDNLFRGMSSFMVEMVELMAILKRNDSNTMVLGDEICRGTEEKSANIIVAYMLETLNNNNTSFITATHLHQIAEMKSVKKLDKIKTKHLKIEYDDVNERLVYSRELCDGQGDKYYGVQVAKYLMKDDLFNRRTKELEEEYENNNKKSNYNQYLVMDKCSICESTKDLETHHIEFQKDFKDKVNIENPHIKKDEMYNLVVLCRECHDNVDNGKIKIKGYIDTSNGRELDYKVRRKSHKKKKYSLEEIELINSVKNMTAHNAKKKLNTEYNMKISSKTIENIWNNNY